MRISAPDGVRVRLAPFGVAAPSRGPRAGARGAAARRKGAAPAESDARDALVAAFRQQELEATHEFTVEPRATAKGRRGAAARRGARGARHVALDVDVTPTESAVVLLEQNGEFTWHFPSPPSPRRTRRGAARRRTTAAAAAPRSVRIEVHLSPARAERRPERRGIGIGAVLAAARGVVLKFVARTSAGVSMKLLERNVRKGLVVMDSHDPTEWRHIDHIDELQPPAGKTLQVLLWVHGTFSSTAGSFGALAATADGRALLDEARRRYDVVLGFDHATLSEDPQENAIDLIERLGRFERPMRIDAVTYSRGGLVFRSLVEQLLPASGKRPELGPVVFVAVPNNGTLLAEPENWRALIDLYTNLSVGAFRLLALLPEAAPSARILSELVSGLGALVKYLAGVVLAERLVPGLAAQEPSGEFVRSLNETSAGQPIPESCRYLAVTSNFDPRAALDGGKPTGLAASFLGKLANGLVDGLMKEDNDLVVNGSSMKHIDPGAGNFIDAALDFGNSPTVYHTVYFAQPQVAQQLRGWLLDDTARTGLMARHGKLTLSPSPRSPFTRVRFRSGDNVRPSLAEGEAPDEKRAAGGASRRGAGRRAGVAAAPSRPTKSVTTAPTPETEWDVDVVQQAAEHHLRQLFGLPHPPAPPPPAPAPPTREEARVSGRTSLVAARAVRTAGVAPTGTIPRNYAPTLVPHSMQRSAVAPGREIKVMSYAQTHATIPIFGARAVVELDDKYDLVTSSAKLARVDGVSPVPGLTPADALASLAKFTGMRPGLRSSLAGHTAQTPPLLTFFHDREHDAWHLAYLFEAVPVLPPSSVRRRRKSSARRRHVSRDGHGMGPSPRQRFPRLDYLVDAHDGSVVYYYSIAPTAAKKTAARKKPARGGSSPKALPGMCLGIDDEAQPRQFFGLSVPHGFELVDPQRSIRTFDLGGGDIDKAKLPPAPIQSATFDFGRTSTAGISAHVNSTHVFNFYNDVLLRRGVDDNGMELVNVVNVVSPADEDPPTWNNAVWWNRKMWYGQASAGRKKFRSFARYLDIIGHELTHGVTETTSNLVYRDEAGALNESFSDILGVIINNWVRCGPDSDPSGWDWRIGVGLGEKRGAPLRSMKDPSITGDPAHTKDMLRLKPGELASDDNDYGFVHTNSNIHNKAAYNLLTARDASARGKRKPLVMLPSEVARLYYFTLQRLDRVATFEDVLDTLIDVATVVYPDPAARAPRLAAIREAYRKVGIPREREGAPAPAKRARRRRGGGARRR